MKKINSNYFVSAQISVNDLEVIKSQGIKSIVCNRPDNEADDQTNYAEIEAEAQSLGMEICFIPIDRNGINIDHINSFKEALAQMQQPILAYCRSGMRSTSIWALSNPENITKEEIIQKAEDAGYDISAIAERITST